MVAVQPAKFFDPEARLLATGHIAFLDPCGRAAILSLLAAADLTMSAKALSIGLTASDTGISCDPIFLHGGGLAFPRSHPMGAIG